MDLILCHTTADFDTLGAAVGMTYLIPGARIILSGEMPPSLRRFWERHCDAYVLNAPLNECLIDHQSVDQATIRSLSVVDTSERSRLGPTAEWLSLPQLESVQVYDHLRDSTRDDFCNTSRNSDHDSADDIPASTVAPTQITREKVGSTTTLVVEKIIEQLSERLRESESSVDAVAVTLMALGIHQSTGSLTHSNATPRDARAIAWLMEQGANLTSRHSSAPLTARDLMSSPVRTIRPEMTVEAAQRLLLRYGHSGLCIVDQADRLTGIISRRDLDLAMHHGFRHVPVEGYMSRNLKTITPEADLAEIERLMVTYDVGRLPVLDAPSGQASRELLGIVTRTDVLRTRYRKTGGAEPAIAPASPTALPVRDMLSRRLLPQLWQLLETAAEYAEAQGWHLYLVGGGVRDLLLADPSEPLLLNDVDLVVDGFHRSLREAAGVELAEVLQDKYPAARLEVHGKFQTAALLWHHDPIFQSLWVDIATARTEFYPYPAANPEVEASSIRQDLYRRDFTINALAVQLTQPRAGEMLDFFGGGLDLRDRQIRVLHANSFIEDPTRIYRAVRFAVRLGFEIEAQTRGYITYALNSGVYERTQGENAVTPALQTRLRSELEYILEAGYWKPALQLLGELTALRCLHPDLCLTPELWQQVRRLDYLLRQLSPRLKTPPCSWLLRLEVLIAALDGGDRSKVSAKVATKLQLPADSIQRLSQLVEQQEQIETHLIPGQRPSQIHQHLSRFSVPTLLLVATRTDRRRRRCLWRYLTDWMQAKPPLNGNDLKALGYRPGKSFKPMLSRVLAAYLDGELGPPDATPQARKQAAQELIAEHFPTQPDGSSG